MIAEFLNLSPVPVTRVSLVTAVFKSVNNSFCSSHDGWNTQVGIEGGAIESSAQAPSLNMKRDHVASDDAGVLNLLFTDYFGKVDKGMERQILSVGDGTDDELV